MEAEQPVTFRDVRPDPAATIAGLQDNRNPIWLILDGLTDPRNVGSVFRLADAARVQGIILIRMDNIMQSSKLIKVARSTTQLVPTIYYKDWNTFKVPEPLLKMIALEWTNQSVPYSKLSLDWPLGLVVGNEQSGISPEGLQHCQQSIHIPMLGLNSSMNASMAAGIAVYGLLERGKFL